MLSDSATHGGEISKVMSFVTNDSVEAFTRVDSLTTATLQPSVRLQAHNSGKGVGWDVGVERLRRVPGGWRARHPSQQAPPSLGGILVGTLSSKV